MITKVFGAVIGMGVVVVTAGAAVGQLQIFSETLSPRTETAQPVLATKAPVAGASEFLSAGLTDLRMPSKVGSKTGQPEVLQASVTHALSRQTTRSLLEARTPGLTTGSLAVAMPAGAPVDVQEYPLETLALLDPPQPVVIPVSVVVPDPVYTARTTPRPAKPKPVLDQRWMIGVYR